MGCKVHLNRHRNLTFRLYFNGIESWEGTGLKDMPRNREKVEAKAKLVTAEIEAGNFNYLKWFPEGNKAHLFGATQAKDATVETYFQAWKETLKPPKVRPVTAKNYISEIRTHILPTLGAKLLSSLNYRDLESLQQDLQGEDLSAATINRAIHHAFRRLCRDARKDEYLKTNLFDRDFIKRLTEQRDEPDPYSEEERSQILEDFKKNCLHYFPFAYFQFWAGCRPSEACGLRWRNVDLDFCTARIQRSYVEGYEGPTKTGKPRTIVLHSNVVRVLTELRAAVSEDQSNPDDPVFRSINGQRISENNFQKRYWAPTLARLKIRLRPFRNTRHTYISQMLQIGTNPEQVAQQVGTSYKMIKEHYQKYIPSAQDWHAVERLLSKDRGKQRDNKERQPVTLAVTLSGKRKNPGPEKRKKPLISQGLKDGAGDRGRTDDLMLGKHTL